MHRDNISYPYSRTNIGGRRLETARTLVRHHCGLLGHLLSEPVSVWCTDWDEAKSLTSKWANVSNFDCRPHGIYFKL